MKGTSEATEPFLPYRDRIVYALAVVTVVMVFPFAVNNWRGCGGPMSPCTMRSAPDATAW